MVFFLMLLLSAFIGFSSISCAGVGKASENGLLGLSLNSDALSCPSSGLGSSEGFPFQGDSGDIDDFIEFLVARYQLPELRDLFKEYQEPFESPSAGYASAQEILERRYHFDLFIRS